MEKRLEIPALISGFIFMFLIAGIKYVTDQHIGLIGLLATFLFGAAVGIVGMSEHTSYIKNILFIATFTWLIWAAFTPIQTVGDNWVINQPYLLLGLTIFIIFAEREFLNIFRRLAKKPAKSGIGLLGFIAIYVLLGALNLLEPMWGFIGDNAIYLFIFLIIWWGIIYVLISKQLRKATNAIVDKLNRGR